MFELRVMVQNGEYTEHPVPAVSDSANYAWEYVIASPIEKLYQFALKEEVFKEFSLCVEENRRNYMDKHFHSLDILETIL